MHGPYADHLLDASDVCSNCLRKTRLERVDPVRGGITRELDSHLERDDRRTEIGYGPADRVSEQKGVFCTCGVEGSFERVWRDEIGPQQFRRLLKNTMRTLAEKGVSYRRKTMAGTALQEFRNRVDARGTLFPFLEAGTVDDILSNALGAAIATATATDDRRAIGA